MSAGYADHQAHLYTKSQAQEVRVVHSLHISAISVKKKKDDGWLAERKDLKKQKEQSINITKIMNRRYNKSWSLYQNGGRECN